MANDFFESINFQLEQPDCGRLLISEPFLPDPNFSRSVVLLTEHNQEGTIGFVLNRPSELLVGDVVDELAGLKSPVFMGGPVGLDQLFFVHTLADQLENAQHIVDQLYWGGNFEQLKLMITSDAIRPDQIRFFAGYSGWSPGQLDAEIEERSWIVAKAPSGLLLNNDAGEWDAIMKQLGRKFEIMANFPENPNLN